MRRIIASGHLFCSLYMDDLVVMGVSMIMFGLTSNVCIVILLCIFSISPCSLGSAPAAPNLSTLTSVQRISLHAL
jgi:hypothetical protein